MFYDALFEGSHVDALLDSGYVPHAVIRVGIRKLLGARLRTITAPSLEDAYAKKMAYVQSLKERPIAVQQEKANEQHYEVGTGVLQGMLGPMMKYSACLYPTGKETLAEAEKCMMEAYVERAELVDGQDVLDLGCGWGSASLYLAERFPNSRITGFSNSRTQKEHIDSVARAKNLTNLTITTGDVVTYTFTPETYDRIISIELFEHMKNYELLLAKLSPALRTGGKLFVHIFTNSTTPYDFEDDGSWMSTHFFSGGTMPSADLLHYFTGSNFKLGKQWWVSGRHYAHTCEDWLKTMASNRKAAMKALEETYGAHQVTRWWCRWEIFHLACAELFAFDGGDVWGVSHYLFEKI